MNCELIFLSALINEGHLENIYVFGIFTLANETRLSENQYCSNEPLS